LAIAERNGPGLVEQQDVHVARCLDGAPEVAITLAPNMWLIPATPVRVLRDPSMIVVDRESKQRKELWVAYKGRVKTEGRGDDAACKRLLRQIAAASLLADVVIIRHLAK